MKRLIHRHVRRLINWLNTPSDEELREDAAERRLARLSWNLGSDFRHRGDELFGKMSIEELDQVADDIKLIAARGSPLLEISTADMHLSTIKRIRMQKLGGWPTPRTA